ERLPNGACRALHDRCVSLIGAEGGDVILIRNRQVGIVWREQSARRHILFIGALRERIGLLQVRLSLRDIIRQNRCAERLILRSNWWGRTDARVDRPADRTGVEGTSRAPLKAGIVAGNE